MSTDSISIQASVSKGWLFQNGGMTFNEKYFFDPLYRHTIDKTGHQLVEQHFPLLPIYNMESNLVQAEYFDPSQVLVGGIQPNLILAMACGATLRCFPDKDADVNCCPLQTVLSAKELPTGEKLLESEIIKELDDQVVHILKNFPQFTVIPPFFWDQSGRATIHGLMTTAQKLFGERIFFKIYDNPQELSDILQWINNLYISLIQHYSKLGNISTSSIHIGECSGSMISGEHFDELIVPFINKLGHEFHSVRFHSCGYSDHLLLPISRSKNLDVIDTGSNTSIAQMRAIFGRDFEINIAPPVEYLLQSKDSNQIVYWLDKTLYENDGGPLKIVFHIEADYAIENCLKIFEHLAQKQIDVNTRMTYPITE